jgi:pimeloyl-ACP methyl ester carboxylesterase
MWRAVRVVLRVAVIAYLGLCGTLFFFQRSLLYFPQPGSGNGDATMIALPTATARVLVCTRPKEGRRALIYFGGNAEDVSLNMPSFSAALPDHALYLLHYRGYGGSSGRPSEEALFADALTLFDEAHATHPDVDVVGRSLGSGIAAYAASRRAVARLVLVTPYDSVQELAARQFPYVPVRWLLLDKFESWRFAPHINAPTLIVAADHDEVVPRASTELLRSRFRSGLASFAVLPGTGHNTISDSPEYLPLLSRWLAGASVTGAQ